MERLGLRAPWHSNPISERCSSCCWSATRATTTSPPCWASSPTRSTNGRRAALTELGGSDPDAEVGLTDYLLGQADPIGRADAVRHLQSDPEAQALAQKIAAQLQLLAPDADLPQLPGRKAKRAKRPADADEPRDPAATAPRAIPGSAGAGALAASARTRWDEHRQQSAIILAAVAAVLIVGVLLLTGVIGGGDDGLVRFLHPAARIPAGAACRSTSRATSRASCRWSSSA